MTPTEPVDQPADDDLALTPSRRSDRRVARLVARPLQVFLQTEYGGGVLLALATAAALIWANSPWSDSYERVWTTSLTVRVGGWIFPHDLRHWINEGLMTVFFFVVGLEIRRELVIGELRNRQAAALPILAAVGGMVVPALIYILFNTGGVAIRGWGIPMATDIAFAVAVLAIVGRRLPAGLRAFLLALAIVDDIGAIVVIAVFYAGRIVWAAVIVAASLSAAIWFLQRLSVRWSAICVVLGVGTWFATIQSGIHATIAGAALGLITPLAVQRRRRTDAGAGTREALPPLRSLEVVLHPWSSYLIIPLFALANAGINITEAGWVDSLTDSVALGVMAGLIVGKPLGIAAGAWLGTRSGLARLPAGVRWPHLFAVGAIAGIGFTVSLFISDLAFSTTRAFAAKLGILIGSFGAAVVGCAIAIAVARADRFRIGPAG